MNETESELPEEHSFEEVSSLHSGRIAQILFEAEVIKRGLSVARLDHHDHATDVVVLGDIKAHRCQLKRLRVRELKGGPVLKLDNFSRRKGENHIYGLDDYDILVGVDCRDFYRPEFFMLTALEAFEAKTKTITLQPDNSCLKNRWNLFY